MSIFDWLKNKSDFFSFCSLFLILAMKGNEKLPKRTPKEPPISLDEIMEIDFITEKIQQTKKRKQKTVEKRRKRRKRGVEKTQQLLLMETIPVDEESFNLNETK